MLLDTHVWLWFHLGKRRLSKSLIKALEHSGESFYLSAISLWEAIVLAEKKRIFLSSQPATAVREMLNALPLTIIPISPEIAIQSRELAFLHEDPADRFICATAKVHNLTIVTDDAAMGDLDWVATISPAKFHASY